jgi:hypothetical protein
MSTQLVPELAIENEEAAQRQKGAGQPGPDAIDLVIR